jgi:hypothetical protein
LFALKENICTSRKCLRFKKRFARQENVCALRKCLRFQKMFPLQEKVCTSRSLRFKKMFALPENVRPSGKGLRNQDLSFERTQHFCSRSSLQKVNCAKLKRTGHT